MKCKVLSAEIGLAREANFTMSTVDKLALRDLMDEFHDAFIEVTVKKYREKRSVDANNYLWALIGKISLILRIPKDEIYVKMVHDIGIYDTLSIKTEAVAGYTKRWSGKGLGWSVAVNGRNRENPDMTDLVCYYGTSVYSTAEFALIVDAVIGQCRELGIMYETGSLRALLEDGKKV